MKILSLLAFLPDEAIPLIVLAGAFALLFRQRALALVLFQLVAMLIFLPILIEPFLDILPLWALQLLMIFLTAAMFFTIVRLLIGDRATDFMLGSLAADLFKWSLFAPFRLIRWIFFRPRH